jgi:hypothetical protein
LSPNQDLVLTRRYLQAATLLWQFLRVGYGPDVSACLSAIDDVVPAQVDLSLQQRLEKRGLTTSLQINTSQQQPEPERGGRRHRREIVESTALLGPDLPALPLLRLRQIARSGRFVANNDLTQSELDDTEKLAFRWFKHNPESGELRARLLGRALQISPSDVQARLQRLEQFAWRNSVVTPHHLHQQGTAAASDIRMAGSARGLWEVAIASPDAATARRLLGAVVEVLADGAEVLPSGGVAGAVAEQLAAENLRVSKPSTDFWHLRSGQ